MRKSYMIALCLAMLFVIAKGNTDFIHRITQDLESVREVLNNIDEHDRQQIDQSHARSIFPELGYAITGVYVAVANILGRFTTPKPQRSIISKEAN